MKDFDKIKALGMIEGYRHDVRRIHAHVEELPLWNPAAGLLKECREVLRRMEGLKDRFDRKLIITIIGPGGAGKSTLMNALGGKDNLSAAGIRRPTTEKTIVLSKESQDADDLKSKLGANNVQVITDPGNRLLEHCLLLDTPDTDSTAREDHIPIVRAAIDHTDVLLCVFNAENPKTRDHVDFFSAYIPYFQGSALIGILNKCDRLDEAELRQAILPEFERHIQTAWQRPLESVFCVSARRHLRQPGWAPNAHPRHDFDQFEELAQVVADYCSRSEHGPQSRVKNARHLHNFIQGEVDAALEKYEHHLHEAREQAIGADQNAIGKAFEKISENGNSQGLGVNVLLYQRLATQWFGPIGWMIAIWARILILGTGIMAMIRFGNPIRQVKGVMSSMRHFKDTRSEMTDVRQNDRVNAGMQAYRVAVLKNWPAIAEKFVQGGFQAHVRQVEQIIPQQQDLSETLSDMWQQALNEALERKARVFSHFALQIIFNVPILALLGHIGWLTTRHYVMGDYLSYNFFLHAFLTAAIVLFLSFFLLQGCLRLFSGPQNIVRRAFRNIQKQMDPLLNLSDSPLFKQLEMVLALGRNRNSDRQD